MIPNTVTSAIVRSRQTMSLCGVGQPEVKPIASASGIAVATAAASALVIRGRRATRFHISSSKKPIWIGVRRTWNALAPITASAMFSFT